MNWLRLRLQQIINEMESNCRVSLVESDRNDRDLTFSFCLLASVDTMHDIDVEYVTFPGWRGRSTSECRTFNSLPHNARLYVQFIEQYLGVPGSYSNTIFSLSIIFCLLVKWIGVGKDRTAMIRVF